MKKGSLVRFIGKSKTVSTGKLLTVHDVKDGKAVVWVLALTGKWIKKTLDVSDLEDVSDPPEG